ncbi:unnamed protein product [Closterium sp. NIES-53]
MSAPPAATIIISVLVALLLVVLFALGIKMLLDRSKAARSEDTDAPAKATTVITTTRNLSSARMKPRQGAVHVVGGTDDDEDAEIPRARAEKWSLADVAEATAQFAQERVIEAEGQSVVLRGSARDGRDVAVKRCKQPQPETQALFLREVMLITSLRHPNLLPLVGYCDEGREQILIFEHMQHGSLASWLRPPAEGNVSRPPLTFEQRLRIAADVARAVEFLHSQPKPVVHRDVKTDTILLDEKFSAKLGGLGTRKHLPGESSRVRVQRRKGYLDPEYCQTFVVTTKAEIFAVGVVILELITGRPPVVEEEVVAKAGRNTVKIVTLAQWAIPKIKDENYGLIVDERMEEYPTHKLEILTKIASECLNPLRLKPASAGVGADQRGSDAERLGNGAVLAGSGAVNSGAVSEQQSAEPGGVPRNGSRSPRLSPRQPPAFQLSPQQQPPHHQPSPYQQVPHQQAPHQQPSHHQSPYQQVSHQQAQYQQPPHQHPQYQQPPHQPPPYQQPQYQQAPHQQPQQEAVPQQESSQGPSPSLSHTSSVGPSQTASFGSQGGTPGSVQIAATLLQFSYNELFEATNGFSREGKLGEGGFGSVHKGRVHVGGGRMEEVAVKALNQEGYQGEAEWVTEVRYLGALGHPNLVRLVGYCMEGQHRLLAYELMEYGSLERYLFRRNVTPLPWNIRMKVALHAARGLAYLHEETEAQVIYRDFKASNILVDREFNAKLSDFGLAKDGPVGSDTHVSTRVMGTYGYAAPEYMLTGHLTAKSDVYSFGVVLLEIISGRRAVERNFPPGQQNIVEWSAPFFADRRMLVKIVDQRLEHQFSVKGVVKAARLAYNCLKKDPKERPLMSDAVQTLSVLQNLTDFPPPLPVVPPAPSASPPSAAAAQSATTGTA